MMKPRLWRLIALPILMMFDAVATYVMSALKSAAQEVWVPSPAEALKEIEATGETLTTTGVMTIVLPRRSTDSGARKHVQMLKSLNGMPLAA